MATLTVDVSPEILIRAKARAAARNTTVEHILEISIMDLASEGMSQSEVLSQLEAWSKAHPFSVDFKSFTREELNER